MHRPHQIRERACRRSLRPSFRKIAVEACCSSTKKGVGGIKRDKKRRAAKAPMPASNPVAGETSSQPRDWAEHLHRRLSPSVFSCSLEPAAEPSTISVGHSRKRRSPNTNKADHCRVKAQAKLRSNHGPVIVSDSSKHAFGSHPCRVVSILSRQRSFVLFQLRRPLEDFALFLLESHDTQRSPCVPSHKVAAINAAWLRTSWGKTNREWTSMLDLFSCGRQQIVFDVVVPHVQI